MGKHEDAMQSILHTMDGGRQIHIKALEGMSSSTEGKSLYHSTMVQGFDQAIHASRLVAVARDLGEQIQNSATKLATALDSVAAASDVTARRLKTWTMWLAIATFILAAATIALVGVEYSHESAPMVVVIPPPSR